MARKKEPKRCVSYHVRSYPRAMGNMRDDGVCVGEDELLAKVKELVGRAIRRARFT